MRKEYDFTNAKKNPYASNLKKQITINLDVDTIDYFKNMALEIEDPIYEQYRSDILTNYMYYRFKQI